RDPARARLPPRPAAARLLPAGRADTAPAPGPRAVTLTPRRGYAGTPGAPSPDGARAGERATTRLPRTSTSMCVFWNVSTASAGVVTIGSFSLNDVLSRIGTPVSRSNSL